MRNIDGAVQEGLFDHVLAKNIVTCIFGSAKVNFF